eukprot:m.157397 g.157397  ORF g.157397 m.157397 type:complete len:127 (+) comp23662_c0_seq5:115-495(+)
MMQGRLSVSMGLVCLAPILCGGVIWTDWDKRQVCHPSQFVQPASVAELAQLIHSARASGTQVKVVGAGHSFSPITLTDDTDDTETRATATATATHACTPAHPAVDLEAEDKPTRYGNYGERDSRVE